jgi:hypothetical protein
MPGKIVKKDAVKAADAPKTKAGGIINRNDMLTIQQAIDRKMTIKKFIEARGIKDPKGYLEKAAMEKGIDINKSITEYKHFDRIKEFYTKPVILEEQNVLEDLGQVATIAVIAIIVVVVASSSIGKKDEIIRNIRETAIKEINSALK